MSLVRHSENRPGQDPQIFSSRSTSDFSNACDCLGKIQLWRAGGKNLNGSNRRTVFRLANPTNKSLNHLLHNPQTDTNQKPLTRCPFFRSKPSSDGEDQSEDKLFRPREEFHLRPGQPPCMFHAWQRPPSLSRPRPTRPWRNSKGKARASQTSSSRISGRNRRPAANCLTSSSGISPARNYSTRS